MNAAVLDQLGQGQPGRLAADVVEGTDNDHARRIIDDHIHAGRLFEGADIASFAADDPPLHVVAGYVDCADRGFGCLLGGVALDGGRDDLPCLLLTGGVQMLLMLLDAAGYLVGQFFLETVEHQDCRLLPREHADFVQLPGFLGQ